MVDPTIAFLAGISVGQVISLLLVTGSIKIGEARALKEALKDLIAPQKKRRISNRKSACWRMEFAPVERARWSSTFVDGADLNPSA
jgi:hypothetical protein